MMNAEEAFKLANTNANIDHLLVQINTAASRGDYKLIVPRLSDAQQKKLGELGYTVMPEHNYGAISGRTTDADVTQHRISWFKFNLNGNISSIII